MCFASEGNHERDPFTCEKSVEMETDLAPPKSLIFTGGLPFTRRG